MKLKSVVDGPILHSKSVVDGPILHSKSVVDGSILHSKAKVCVFSVFMMVKLLIYHTGMCIKGPESWWIAKSIYTFLFGILIILSSYFAKNTNFCFTV